MNQLRVLFGWSWQCWGQFYFTPPTWDNCWNKPLLLLLLFLHRWAPCLGCRPDPVSTTLTLTRSQRRSLGSSEQLQLKQSILVLPYTRKYKTFNQSHKSSWPCIIRSVLQAAIIIQLVTWNFMSSLEFSLYYHMYSLPRLCEAAHALSLKSVILFSPCRLSALFPRSPSPCVHHKMHLSAATLMGNVVLLFPAAHTLPPRHNNAFWTTNSYQFMLCLHMCVIRQR